MTEEPDDYECPPDKTCIKSMLHRAFGLFWEQKGLLISAHLILVAILLGGDYLLRGVGGNVLLGPFVLGMYKINLAIVRNKNTDISDILAGFEYFLPAFIANILIHLATFIGTWLLIVPGLIIFVTYAPTYLFILERNMGFWDAMEASRAMVWGNKKLWVSLGLALVAINLSGLLCFVVGLIVTISYTQLLITLAYETEINREKPLVQLEHAEMTG